jgi:hypothetical protein
MKKILLVLAVSGFSFYVSFAQKGNYIRPNALGVSFVLNDFATAERVRNSSVAAVIRDKEWSKFKEMTPGLAISYFKGLRNNIDFASTLAGSFAKISLPDDVSQGDDKFLLEGDASVNLKMFNDHYIFTPYINVGVGLSVYKGDFGTFIPLGGGFKVNLFDEAAIFINSQYRIPVTSATNNYHFFNSIGIAGVIGGKKED